MNTPKVTDADREAAEKIMYEIAKESMPHKPWNDKDVTQAAQMGMLHERAKVDELVRALERIRDLPMEGVTLTRQRIATEALKQFSGRSG